MRVFRIVEKGLARNAYDGKGGLDYPGRWHYKGQCITYTSASASLAALEILARVEKNQLRKRYVIVPALIPGKARIKEVDVKDLPRNWASSPAPDFLKDLGNRWLMEEKTAILAVPSAVMQIEKNYIINPEHPDFLKIRIEKPLNFTFDLRFKG